MNLSDVDREFQRLALLELHHRIKHREVGRKLANTDAYIKLIERVFIDKVSLKTACNQLGLYSSNLYKRGFRFLDFRPAMPNTNRGNKLNKSYKTSYKIELADRLLSGETYQSLTIETGIPYTTLSKWVLQYKAGAFDIDNASGFKTK